MKVMSASKLAALVATIGVRPHGFTAAGLLAASALLGLLGAFDLAFLPAFPPDAYLIALLGGLTLLAQAVSFWYLPSFAKREVVMDGMASYAGPLLFPAAVVAALIGSGAARTTMLVLGLSLFPLVLVASALFGPRWRSGVPFWRKGEHRTGDTLALAGFAASMLWFAAAAVLAAVRPPGLVIAWPTALALFAVSALAHLVPRARGREAWWPLFGAGLVLANAGAIFATALRVGEPLVRLAWTYPLLLGFAVAGLALARPGGKRAGPRMRDARPLLAAALLAGAIGIALVVRQPMTALRATIAHELVTVAVALAIGAVAILALPVVFNAVPDTRFVWPTAVLALLGLLVLAGELWTELVPWRGTTLLAGSVACYLGAMWPLRRPRRDCPPDDA